MLFCIRTSFKPSRLYSVYLAFTAAGLEQFWLCRLPSRGSIFNWLAGAATDRSCDPPVATGSCQNQTGSCQWLLAAASLVLAGHVTFQWLSGGSCDPPVATGSCQNQTGSCQWLLAGHMTRQTATGRSRDLPVAVWLCLVRKRAPSVTRCLPLSLQGNILFYDYEYILMGLFFYIIDIVG